MQDKLKSPLFGKSGLLKPLARNKVLLVVFLALLFFGGIFIYSYRPIFQSGQTRSITQSKFGNINSPSPIPSPSPSPTPRPLTFSEMNALYGPCVQLPTLMYHHVQSKDAATIAKQTGLTVYTDIFKAQMEYLKSKNYNVLSENDLINFFDNGAAIPKHSVLITFDDGYQDFYTDAFPILQSLGLHATMFVPTGLMQNLGYMTWDEINSMNGLVLFANHTWSHKNVQVSGDVMRSEISTADTQLSDHGLNSPKTFAYPYGLETGQAETYLASLGYKIAFTTKPGSVLCKKQRFGLPRIRIGNSPLSNYGF